MKKFLSTFFVGIFALSLVLTSCGEKEEGDDKEEDKKEQKEDK